MIVRQHLFGNKDDLSAYSPSIVMVLILLNLAKHLKVNSGINVEEDVCNGHLYFKLFAFRKIAWH